MLHPNLLAFSVAQKTLERTSTREVGVDSCGKQ